MKNFKLCGSYTASIVANIIKFCIGIEVKPKPYPHDGHSIINEIVSWMTNITLAEHKKYCTL